MAGKSGVTVKVVSNRLPEMPAKIRVAVGQQIEQSARTIEAQAKQAVPVRTGNLRRSINTQMGPGNLSAIVATGVEYGLYVERGTRRMPARPFLVPSFEREIPRLLTAVRQALRGLL